MDLPELGAVFEARYELLELLGEGGFARVYRARDMTVAREVALKILSPTGGKYREVTAKRFLREVRLIAALQDPHTITLYDFGQTDDGLLYMACEYIPGEDLKHILDAQRTLPPRVVAHILSQVLQSLREAHRSKITHRDIKPANILVYEYEEDRYRAKLVDFGLAKPGNVDATQITRKGFSAGTPRYMSPEQVLGQGVGPASDIYSLGLVAYEMLTGEPAVDADDRKELLRKHVVGPRIELAPEAGPLVLRDVVERMMERELNARYTSVEDVLADLQRLPRHFVGPADVSEEAETRPRRPLQDRLPETADELPQNRTTLAIALMAIALVVFVLVALALPTDDSKPDVVLPPSVSEVPTRTDRDPDPAQLSDVGTPEPGVSDAAMPDASGGNDMGPRSGCGLPRKGRVYPTTFEAGGAEHLVQVRLPDDYHTNRRYRVIVMFRGRQMRPFYRPDDARDFFSATGLREPAGERGYVLAGVNPPDLANPWLDPIDKEYATALMAAVDRVACVDRSTVYVLGHDLGAAEAHRFACMIPLRGLALWHDIQAVGEERCVPHPAVPVLNIWGRKDRDVGSGERRSNCNPGSPVYIGHVATANQWRYRNGCAKETDRAWTSKLRQVQGSCQQWSCDVAPYVECVLEAGRQLPFPTNAGVRFCQRDIPAFDVAGHTLAFFDQFGRPADR